MSDSRENMGFPSLSEKNWEPDPSKKKALSKWSPTTNGVLTPLSGAISPFITSRAPSCLGGTPQKFNTTPVKNDFFGRLGAPFVKLTFQGRTVKLRGVSPNKIVKAQIIPVGCFSPNTHLHDHRGVRAICLRKYSFIFMLTKQKGNLCNI